MKRIFTQLSAKIIIGFIISVAILLAKSGVSNETACASYWGSCGDESHQVCPANQQPISACISSVNTNIGIMVQGNGVKNGTNFRVDLYSDVQACSDVTCLLRADTVIIGPYDGTSAQMSNFSDKIGCSTGGCTVNGQDVLNANAYITGSGGIGGLLPGATCTVTNENGTLVTDGVQKKDVKSMNGSEISFIFIFNCSIPATLTLTPTVTPTAIPTLTPTPPVCTTPAAPQPTVTCLGCQ